MTIEAGRQKADAAKDHHRSGRYEDAVEAYTSAAYEYLGANGLDHSRSTVSNGLKYLTISATCLRFLGRREECQNLCWQGVYVSKVVAERALSRPPASHPHDQAERGVWYEFEGDLRMVGGLDGADEAYGRAESVYRDADDPECVACEAFFGMAALLTKNLVWSLDIDPNELEAALDPSATLTDWLDFKRRKLPDYLRELEESDSFEYRSKI